MVEVRVAAASPEPPAPGQGAFGIPGVGAPPSDPVAVRFDVTPAAAARGAVVTVRATVTVDEGWHVYDPSETRGVPTELSIELPPGVELVGSVVVPPPEQASAGEGEPPLAVHGGTFPVAQQVRIPPPPPSVRPSSCRWR